MGQGSNVGELSRKRKVSQLEIWSIQMNEQYVAPTEVGNMYNPTPTHVARLSHSLLAVEFRGALLASLATFHGVVTVAFFFSML